MLEGGGGGDFLSGALGNDLLAGNTTSEVIYDLAPDVFIFEGRFGDDVISDFEIDWDNIELAVITQDDITVSTVRDDVLIEVDLFGGHSITVLGVASQFDENINITFL